MILYYHVEIHCENKTGTGRFAGDCDRENRWCGPTLDIPADDARAMAAAFFTERGWVIGEGSAPTLCPSCAKKAAKVGGGTLFS